ncbi:MAG: endonuclease MutS2 [Erysipelotrichales bacterium]|nr:endonuclease MutS2 [Erysipelotrichales bacterium]
MKFDIQSLELNKIIAFIEKEAVTLNGKRKVLELEPINEIDKIRELLLETETLRKIIIAYSVIPFPTGPEITEALKRVELGASISLLEIIDIRNFLEGVKNILRFFNFLKAEKMDYIALSPYLELLSLDNLVETIKAQISEEGAVLDNASDILKEIRKGLKKEENSLREKINELLIKNSSLLSESLIVVRNNRFCLPVKIEAKNSLKGIIHDESSSGQTVYIEPAQTFEISIRIQNLKEKENREIARIIALLSSLIALNVDDIYFNITNVTTLDCISAKAKYATKNNFFMPKITDERFLQLNKARHPLLNPETAVPLDLTIGRNYRGIIVTGPNTGGKTVSLKTVGLLSLMAQTGILIPAEESSVLPVFDSIYSDIGDEQSIEQSLSTFSSHLAKIIQIISATDKNSLVLLDELGSGTDPKEGAGLAKAIIDHFMATGAFLIATTHYPDLKEYAFATENVINASMEFNHLTFAPLYRLITGISGKSNAIEIARRLGLKADIIKKAEDNLKINDDKTANLVAKLESHSYQIQEEKLEAEKNRLRYEELKADYERKIQELNNREAAILKKAETEGEKYLLKIKEDAALLIDELEEIKKSAELKEPQLAQLKHQIKEVGKKELKANSEQLPITLGDTVLILQYQKEGIVTKISKGNYTVRFGNLEFNYKDDEIRFIRKTVKKEKTKPKAFINLDVSRDLKLSLDLRGFRFEDVKDELEKFIDRAVLNNMTQVSIIHGFGTGAVRKAVQEYLKKSPYIKSTRFGGQGEGLAGVTVAYLK